MAQPRIKLPTRPTGEYADRHRQSRPRPQVRPRQQFASSRFASRSKKNKERDSLPRWLTFLLYRFFFNFGFNISRLISFRYPGKVWVECPSSTVGSHGGPVAGFGWARPRRSTGHGVDGFYRWGNEHNSVRTRRQFSRFPLLSRLSRRMDQREQGTAAADGQL